MIAKTEEIIEISHEEQADAALVAGDIYHSPTPAYGVSNAVFKRWEQFGIPIFVAPGNHDLLGDQIESLPETALGTLAEAGIVRVFRDKSDMEIFEKHGVRLQISGTPYQAITVPQDLMVNKLFGMDQAIHLIHHMLIPQKFNEKVPYVSIEEIADTGADLTICGHNHIGLDLIIANGKMFMSNGSISRLRLPERIHQPKVTIYDVHKDHIEYRHRFLKKVEYAESLFIEGRVRRIYNIKRPNGAIFINKKEDYKINADIPALLTDNAKKMGFEHVLPTTLATFNKYKQKSM
jgi:exonuclease SbcD